MSRTLFLMSAVVLGGWVLGGSGCAAGEQALFERSMTSTVTLSAESTLVVNLAVPVTLEGSQRSNDVVIHADFAVTASTATVARLSAEAVKIVAEPNEAKDALLVTLSEPERGRFASGAVRITLPADLDVDVTERGGTVDVLSVAGSIRVNSLSHVRVVGAQDDLFVAVEGGNALVDTDLEPGKSTMVRVNQGDIELTAPPALSASIEATAASIAVSHPRLPRWPGPPHPYRASVNGGLNAVALSTERGVIVIRSR